ncbi:MAG TPA: hypothetical protein VHD87_13295 [Acidimicrobiales bacterium]|nr:hypothetical protein [Acidimicrobiales bacterium]
MRRLPAPRSRRLALPAARFATGAFAAAFVIALLGVGSPAQAATDGGGSTVVSPNSGTDPNAGQPLGSGGSATKFTLKLPSGAACSGDTATGGFHVQSYMVPSTVSPSSVTYDAQGPTPQHYNSGGTFRMPLWIAGEQKVYVNAATNVTDGVIINVPSFDFAVYSPGDIPAGTYNVGIACTNNQNALDKFWNTQMTFTTSPADSPAQVTWTAQAPSGGGGGTTTTSTTAAGGGGGGTTTTSTTVAGGGGGTTTTTVAGGGTTSTTRATTTTTLASSGGTTVTTSPTASSVGDRTLSRTGRNITWLLAFGVLALICGRIAFLLARPTSMKGSHFQ